MTKSVRAFASLLCAIAVVGCGTTMADPVEKSASYQNLGKADVAFAAKRYGEALPLFDEAIRTELLQADVLAEAYVRRAICRIETGDLKGATADLEQAERGGAVGEEYQQAQKMLSQKRRGS
jgi:hypothetical protein